MKDINFITPQPMEREKLFQLGNGIEIDQKVNLPQKENLTIMTQAFAYTALLQELYIYDNVKTIENDFAYEGKFKEIRVGYIYEDIPKWNDNKGFHVDWLNGFDGEIYYKYRITLDAGDGTVPISEIQIWTKETMSNLPIATLDGAIFDGWYDAPNGNGKLYKNDTIFKGDKSITLYAKWNVTITFDSDGGSSCNSITLLRGKTTTLPTPTLSGATFGGWYTSKDGAGTQYTSNTAISSNITLHAKWNVTITFDSDGGSSCNSITLVRGKTTTLPTPTLSEAEFAGWFTEKKGEGTQYTSNTAISSNITLYAKWYVTITFDSYGGSTVSNQKVIKGNTTSLPYSSLNGATFGGWYTARAGYGERYTNSDPIKKSIKLYAKWNVEISFDSSGGSDCKKVTGAIGGFLTLPTPTFGDREGYWEFDKDKTTFDFGGFFVITGTSDSFTAIWERYITFEQLEGYGDSNPSKLTLLKGDAWPTISMPTRRGYKADGWFSAAYDQGTQYYTSNGRPLQTYFDLNNDLTLYLTWYGEIYYFNIEAYMATNSEEQDLDYIYAEFEDEFEYTADEIMVSQNGTKKGFTRWSMIRGTVEDYNSETNPWITIAEGTDNRTIKFSMKNIAAQYYPDLQAGETITFRAFYQDSTCIAEGSLITLADGTQKPVEQLTGNEELLVWNFLTGKFDFAPILFLDSEKAADYEVINLYFSDGTNIKVLTEHAFWDFDLNKYVYLRDDAAKYIGHWFNKQTTDEDGNFIWTRVQLTDVVVKEEYTSAWSPVTYGYMGYYVNGMLSIPGDGESFINYFDVVAETMQYDIEAMQKDIDTYGLFTYEEFAELVPVSEEIFNAFNGQYLKISIGKGLTTIERIKELVELYGKYL